MRLVSTVSASVLVALLWPTAYLAQSSQPAPTLSQPRLVNLSGTFHPANGQPAAGVHSVTLAIYTDETGGSPVWEETQTVAVDAEGRYTLLIGATQTDGLPLGVFASGEAQWLGITFQGEAEAPRLRFTSVPYALHAADAATLGGQPASAYMLNPEARGDTEGTSSTAATGDDIIVNPTVVFPGQTGALAKYLNNGDDIGAATISELGTRVGVNTGAALPLDFMHVRYNDQFGAFTGLAVQNMNPGANAAAGMSVYDQNGALSLFQGFNNTSHGYVINNIATGGTVNFAVGGASRFFVANNGNIALGTSSPNAPLQIAFRSNITDPLLGIIRSNVSGLTFSSNPGGGAGDVAYIAHRVKTGEATTLEIGILNDGDDDITLRSAAGRTQLETTTANLGTISVGTTGSRGGASGLVPQGANVAGGFFVEGGSGEASAVYGDSDTMTMWSPGDGGALLRFFDEDNLAGSPRFMIDGVGNINIGFGAAGCVRRADGVIIVGACASDERLKRDIRPFDGNMLDRAMKLRPIYHHWREELMGGDPRSYAGESYGFIAQEVEKIYPEMVTTGQDGYKTVDYSKLPYVLLGALQEEHAKVQSLEARLARLESARWTNSLWGALAGVGLVGLAFYRRQV